MLMHTPYWRTRACTGHASTQVRAWTYTSQNCSKQHLHNAAHVMREMCNTPRLPLEMVRKQTCDCMLSRQFRRGAGAWDQVFAGASTSLPARNASGR
eukprot:6438798-Alexandrium_andersonii.AAC.1